MALLPHLRNGTIMTGRIIFSNARQGVRWLYKKNISCQEEK
jgi:hypothetical protein